jgi:diguanylate cyclase (GGDEF)-like protein
VLTLLRNPRLIPVVGTAAGGVAWLADSLVDHFLFHSDEAFSESLWPGEAQEIWMRLLVIVLFIAVALYARMLLRNEIGAKEALAAHQSQLEDMVAARTRELEESNRSLKKEMAEREQVQAQLEALATTDPLTRLYNRRKFEELLNHELERCRRYAGDFAVILFDVDHFKRVNDTQGHDTGDAVLQFLGDIVRSQLRRSDIVARWGGEEFIVLVAEADADIALMVADKLRRSVEAGQFPGQLCITISLGIALAQRNDTSASVVRRADQALYRAKEAGRNRSMFEAPEPPPQPVDTAR